MHNGRASISRCPAWCMGEALCDRKRRRRMSGLAGFCGGGPGGEGCGKIGVFSWLNRPAEAEKEMDCR